MTSDSPQSPAPTQPEQRGRGLLVAVIILLIAVIALAITLVITLTGDDDDGASAPTDEMTQQETADEPLPADDQSGGAADSAETQAPDTQADVPAPPTAAPDDSADGPSQADLDRSRAIMLEEQHRDPDDPYALGDVDADIVVVQYADYRCGYCAQWHVEVLDGLDPYIESGQVRFEYRDHPVLGDASVYAALAARAAGKQGMFWEYGDALYQDTYAGADPVYDGAYFTSVAERIDVPDIEAFTADLTDGEAYTEIMMSRERALSIGITGTPTFIVHDTLVPGAIDEEQFVALVESKLA